MLGYPIFEFVAYLKHAFEGARHPCKQYTHTEYSNTKHKKPAPLSKASFAGYTLIEMLVVVVIVGTIAAVALVFYAPRSQEEVQSTQTFLDAQSLQDLFERGQNHAKKNSKTVGVHYHPSRGFWLSIYRYTDATHRKNPYTHQNITPENFPSFSDDVLGESRVRNLSSKALEWKSPFITLEDDLDNQTLPFAIIRNDGWIVPYTIIEFQSSSEESAFFVAYGRSLVATENLNTIP